MNRDALAAVRRRFRPAALVLSDVEMPVMDGYGMCRVLKDDEQLRGIPVILLTSFSDPADVLRGLEAGADAYLTKPYDGEFLLERVAAVLSDSETVKESREPAVPFRIVFAGRRHLITAAPRQVLSLLLSTYANAVQRNNELIEAKQRLQDQNKLLEHAARAEHDAHEALKYAQAHLVQTEKLARLGQVVAGVAHEINNPLAFVANNTAVLQRDFAALRDLLLLYAAAESKLEAYPEFATPLREYRERIDLPYTLSNLEDVLRRSREGLLRIEQIVKNLRDFARLDEGDLNSVDLNAGIQVTANIMETKAREKGVKLELALGDLPAVTCYAAKINQAVLNLLSNAIDACSPGGEVAVRTSANGDSAVIEVVDNGSGIDPSIRDKIFDPFFTTKPIGQGKGLGLSITYGIVQEHGGTIAVGSLLQGLDRGFRGGALPTCAEPTMNTVLPLARYTLRNQPGPNIPARFRPATGGWPHRLLIFIRASSSVSCRGERGKPSPWICLRGNPPLFGVQPLMHSKRWLRIIPVALIMYTISYIDRTNVSLALDPGISKMMSELRMDDKMKGEAAGIFFFGYMLLQIPGGYLASRWSARKVNAILLVFWGACAVGCGMATTFREFEIMRFLLGVAESGVYPATLVLLAHWFPRAERARANAFWSLCMPLSVAVSAPLTGWMIGSLGWQKMIMIEGALPFLWLGIWLYFISDHPREARWLSDTERDHSLQTTLKQESLAREKTQW